MKNFRVYETCKTKRGVLLAVFETEKEAEIFKAKQEKEIKYYLDLFKKSIKVINWN